MVPIPVINRPVVHWVNTIANLWSGNMCCEAVPVRPHRDISDRHTAIFSIHTVTGSFQVSVSHPIEMHTSMLKIIRRDLRVGGILSLSHGTAHVACDQSGTGAGIQRRAGCDRIRRRFTGENQVVAGTPEWGQALHAD